MANLLSTSVTGTVNSTGNMTAAGFTGNANVGGTGAATWHPNGIYAGSTQWLYGAMYKNGSGIYDAGEITTSSHGTSANWKSAYDWGNHAGLYAASGHTHDDRYYTETEINNFSYFRNDEDRTLKVLRFTGVGGDSGNSSNHSYAIYQGGGSWSHPYPDLHIGYHTGIKIGANTGYGGIRFYSDSDMATELFSVGNGSSDVRVSNNLSVGGTITGSNLSGTNTGDQTNISGNAATATNVAASGITGQTGMWTSAARPGPYRLYRNDDNSAYNVQTTWSADVSGYWSLRGYSGDTYHAPCYVGYAGYASSAGSVAWGNVSSRPTALSQFSNDLGNYGGWITSSGSISGNAATVTVNSGNGSASWYPILWHSGNNVYSSSGTAEIYPAGGYGRFQYINTTDNDEGGITRFVIKNGDSYHRSASTTVAADIIRGVASGSWSITAARATRANGNFYIDDNYGNTVVGVYSASRLQGVFAMGDAYKLSADGTSASNHYGIAWSHPNHGGTAARLTNHGMLIQGAGSTWAAISDSIWCIGDITAFSDAKVKANVEVIDNPLDRLNKVRGVTFTRTDLPNTSKRYAGVIAQEMREALPEVVTEDGNGELSVSYGNTVSLLIESIKAQQVQIEELKAEVKKLRGE